MGQKSEVTSQSLETQDRILKAALKLFNEHGSGEVSTHDIAEAAGISPGNLYYHFANKQAIVRALFYRIEIFSVERWHSRGPAHHNVAFTDFMRFYFGSLDQYRFFFREFSSLLALDPVLAKEWARTYEHLLSVMQDALDGWVKRGLIKPFGSREEAETFVETIWTLAAFSQNHLEARGRASKAAVADGASRLLIRFMMPYHTDKGRRALELYL